ncbi:MAG: hypothetical protein AAFN10_21870, partial [Bacteroidota bacterium]
DNTFVLKGSPDYVDDYEIHGNFSIKGKNIALVPNPGKIAIKDHENLRDTFSFGFLIRDGLTNQIISGTLITNDFDTIFNRSSPISLPLKAQDSLGVASPGYSPFIFQVNEPGIYEISLFRRIRNRELLNWKIKGENLVNKSGYFTLEKEK